MRCQLPVAVTATESSIRTPATPGMYTPGSTVMHMPGANKSLDEAEIPGRSWICKPMPWPVPWLNSSPYPAAVIDARQNLGPSPLAHVRRRP